MVIAGGDNLLKAFLKGCTTHEEAIDVGFTNEDSGVGLSYRASVKNSCFLCGLLGHVLS